jgi:hypothetical protein
MFAKRLDELPLADRDTKGDVYEYMLGKLAVEGRNGQFRTPRHIIQMMVELVRPTRTDTICDPACGTCGFLVLAGEYLREHDEALFHDEKARPLSRRHVPRQRFRQLHAAHRCPLTSDQIRFIDRIVDHLVANGMLDPEAPFQAPFTDAHYEGVAGVFHDSAEQVIAILRRINRLPDGEQRQAVLE